MSDTPHGAITSAHFLPRKIFSRRFKRNSVRTASPQRHIGSKISIKSPPSRRQVGLSAP